MSTAVVSSAGTPSSADRTAGPRVSPGPVGIVLALTVLLGLMLALFAWPSARSAPRELPIGIAGPAPVAAQISAALGQYSPGAFAITTYADRTAAERAIRERDVYGVIVAGADGPTVLTAGAASPVVAQALGQIGTQLATAQGMTATIEDVVALPAKDPRGAGLGAGMLPIILGGLACGVVVTHAVRRRGARVLTASAFALAGGFTMAAVLHFWIGTLDGSYLLEALALCLAIAAIAFTILGLEAVLGLAGVGLGALVMMILGNALSAAASAPEMLPTGWGALGQVLPPGSTNQLLRSVAFFDGHGALRPMLVLLAWAALGLILAVAAARRHEPLHAA